MDIAIKYKIVERIVNTEDETLLKEIDALLAISKEDFWTNLSASTQASIQRGLEDAEQGKTRPHQEVMKDIKTAPPPSPHPNHAPRQ